MKKYLDYSMMPDFLVRYFPDTSDRAVGPNQSIDSGYFAITRFFGEQKIDPSRVRVSHQSNVFSFSDALVASFAAEREQQLKAEGRLYEGPLVTRVVNTELSSESSVITVQPCRYADQAGTCFALDWSDERFTKSGGTLREYYKRKVPSSSFADIPFPLCFGICGFLLIRNQSEPLALLLMHRSGRLASLEDSVGPSMAGAVDYDKDDTTLLQMLTRSANQEIAEELSLSTNEYRLIPLAYAREIFRGERPQLFCLIVTDVSSEVIAKRLQNAKTDSSEFTQFTFVPLKDGTSADATLASLNHEARMSYWLTCEYLKKEEENR